MRTSRRLAVVTGLATTALAVAAPAEAHTSLTGATPAKGSTVARPPARIVLGYADPVRFPGVVVLDAHGGHHESGKARAAGNKVTEQVAGALAPGVYTVGWRVVSEDGHPVTGEYRFTVAAGASPSASLPVSAAPAAPASSGPAGQPAGPARHSSGRGWLWVGGAAAVVAAAVGGVSLLRRRRPAG